MSQPTVGLFHQLETIEDFLDPLGLSFEHFRDQLTGGWLFGYVDALRTAGVRTVVFCVSRRERRSSHHRHGPTGATIWLVPEPAVHRALRHAEKRLAARLGSDPRWGPLRVARAAASHGSRLLATPVSSLVALVRQEGCQALLCQDYEYPRFEACLVVGRRVGIPVFASFQGANRPLSPLEKPLRRRAVRSAAGLVVAPRSESVRLQERYGIPPSRIARIFNPLDVAQWAPEDRAAARARLGLAGAAQVVAWHGRVEIATKGLDVLADAWERVTAERAGRELILLLVGTGRDAAQYRDRLGDRQDVRWRDEYVLDKAEIRRYLSAADIYVFPSRDEGFPMAPVEAMASALPVVAADAFGIEDIFDGGERSGGMIVPRGDVAALATALGRLLDDPELRRELGGRARRRAEAAFSTEAVGQQLVRTLFGPRHGA